MNAALPRALVPVTADPFAGDPHAILLLSRAFAEHRDDVEAGGDTRNDAFTGSALPRGVRRTE